MNTRRAATRLQSLKNATSPFICRPATGSADAIGAGPDGVLNPGTGMVHDTATSMIDAGIYHDGRRISSPRTLPDTFRELNSLPGSMAWIGLVTPQESELQELAEEFDLHELAIEDAVLAHQRSKLERYGKTLFVVLRAARYLETQEEVEFGELHVFVGANFIITVRHGNSPNLAAVRRRMEQDATLLRLGPEAVLYAILDTVVDGFAPVVTGLANDIDEIETEVFSGDPQVSRRIYELSREVIEFQRSTRPMTGILASLAAGFDKYGIDEELRQYLRDVDDHVAAANERIDSFRFMLRDILTVNSTLVAQRQNEEMKHLAQASNAQNEEVKKISAWAAILFAPTLVGTIYGMNFDIMPELHWEYGYALAILAMFGVSAVLFGIFKNRKWI
ncbi:magnesium and cobalt transport protein CorA [Arthrobacter cryoconiti]|uniref:Magnesium and cobalt transport protein CorA n=1 Tax=Arthrobacter cryoconiti TaxID=748907 RepID=A0ABV8R679_9MICC